VVFSRVERFCMSDKEKLDAIRDILFHLEEDLRNYSTPLDLQQVWKLEALHRIQMILLGK
jgi:hypothetical protein